MKMKTALSVVAAAAVALFTQATFAQDAASAPKARADVKAEAKANKTPAGEAGQAPAKLPKSDKTKAERKASTPGSRAGSRLGRNACWSSRSASSSAAMPCSCAEASAPLAYNRP